MDKYNEYSSKFHEKFMSLKIPTVEKCCCILDLRTAGIVLGGLTLIANLGLICYGEHVIWSVISLICTGCWLYGIQKDKPNFMFGYIISGFIGIVLIFIIGTILVLTLSVDDVVSKPGEAKRTRMEKNIYAIIILIFAGAPSVYFWIVNYSLYKSVLERHNESIESTAADAYQPSEVNAGI